MLSIHEVSKRYGDKTALENVSLELSEGVYALLGPNGAGKSTLMKIITDSLAPTSGQVFWNHTPVQKLGGAYRSLLGYMPQQQGVCEQMTAESFISYIGRLKGLKGKALRAQVDHVLELVNLSDVRHKKVGGFSGGMKQRVLLAQALLGSPKVLLLDEPTAGLDPRERVRIRNFIKELAQDRIVLLATHIVTDIESIADQVLLLKKGKLLRVDTPQNLIGALPADWKPVMGVLSLEDVYLYFLGEQHG